MTSLKLDYLYKDPPTKKSHSEVLGLGARIFVFVGGHIILSPRQFTGTEDVKEGLFPSHSTLGFSTDLGRLFKDHGL